MVRMNGFYIYCRVWVGFSETFPWFEELNPLPDEKIVEELNGRTRSWLRENTLAVKRRYRGEKRALGELATKLRSQRFGYAIHGVPNMDMYEKMVLTEYLAGLDRKSLMEEASRCGIQLALTDQELRAAILAVKEAEHLQRGFKRRELENERNAQDVRDQFNVKKRVRGDRKATSLETRIARVAGWTNQDIRRFIVGISPTPRLLLRWVGSNDELSVLLKVARERFARPVWEPVRVRFAGFSCAGMEAAHLTALELKNKELLDPNSRWTGTPLFQSVLRDFEIAVQQLEAIVQRDKEQRPAAGGKGIEGSGSMIGATVDEVVAKTRKEYFTVYELAQLSGLTEDAVEGRVRRWADKSNTPDASYKLELPEASSGAARYMYRIQLKGYSIDSTSHNL
jgi:hypothetical protein